MSDPNETIANYTPPRIPGRRRGAPKISGQQYVERYQDIVDAYNSSTSNLAAIAREVRLTRERVRQVIERLHKDAPGAIMEGDERRLQQKMKKRFETERAKTSVCPICLQTFVRNGSKFCSRCHPHVGAWYRLVDPSRHEKHRLLVAKKLMKTDNPDDNSFRTKSAQKQYVYWLQHGHLPPPNRDLYVWGESGRYIRGTIGEARWAEIQRKMDEYYFDETRRVP